jgi:hypothetical protein
MRFRKGAAGGGLSQVPSESNLWGVPIGGGRNVGGNQWEKTCGVRFGVKPAFQFRYQALDFYH